ncbi:MAG: dihydrouridine synthase [Acidobacteria bacterium]|nr:MAG: dihydrouridine synthase [Acidobacteriota bacterium]
MNCEESYFGWCQKQEADQPDSTQSFKSFSRMDSGNSGWYTLADCRLACILLSKVSSMWLHSEEPLILLAPMDGYTDSAFRRMVKSIEPRVIVFTEFISARDCSRSLASCAKLFKHAPEEQPLVVQLYGKNPEEFSKAAKMAEQFGAAGIDINMGCPAKKVVAHSHGSALMKDIELAARIIEEVKRHTLLPITVKTRLGWEHSKQLIPFIKKLESAGLDGVTIHGRTYAQKFVGSADWEPIYALKRTVEIPVFGNGDITNSGEARSKLGNLDGVMIGREATFNPWVMKQAATVLLDHAKDSGPVSLAVQIPYWLQYLQNLSKEVTERTACLRFRKTLLALMRRFHIDTQMRKKAVKVENIGDVERVLNCFVESLARKGRFFQSPPPKE